MPPTPEEAEAAFVAKYGEPITLECGKNGSYKEPSYGGEEYHIETDTLMAKLLTQLGYGGLVERIEFGTRWYA